MAQFPFKGFYPFDDDPRVEEEIISHCHPASSSPHMVTCFNDNIALLHINCYSVNNKLDELELYINSFDNTPDLIFLSETWLSNTSIFKIANYNSYHQCRELTKGGEVSICVRDKFATDALCFDFKPTSFEFLGRVVKTLSLICICIYKPPSTAVDVFIQELDNLFDELHAKYNGYKLSISGAFNINLLDIFTQSCNFLDVMLTHMLYPTVFSMTRPQKATLLDNIFYHGQLTFVVMCMLLIYQTTFQYPFQFHALLPMLITYTFDYHANLLKVTLESFRIAWYKSLGTMLYQAMMQILLMICF